MFCPECGAEYRPEISECAECGVRLVVTLPADWRSGADSMTGRRPDPHSKTVEVFSTTDTMLLPIVKSLLESAGVDFYIQGEEALGLLPVGAMGSSVSRASLAARVHVFERDAPTVRQLLSEISETEDVGGAADE